MDKKNLISQVTQPVKCLTIQDLPADLVELSEEELSQVTGGWVNFYLWQQDQIRYRNRAMSNVEGFVPEPTDYL